MNTCEGNIQLESSTSTL